MEPVGIEPTTLCLKGTSSAVELTAPKEGVPSKAWRLDGEHPK